MKNHTHSRFELRPANVLYWLALIALLLALPWNGIAVAAPDADGDLDPSFGAGGMVTTGFGGHSNDYGWQMLRQPGDDKIVMVGDYCPEISACTAAVARFNADATVDTGFGQGGWTYLRRGWDRMSVGEADLQPDGKIVVAGSMTRTGARWSDFVVARLNSDGSVDTTFGDQGFVTTDFGLNLRDQALTVAIQADGKIVAAGFTTTARPFADNPQYTDYSRPEPQLYRGRAGCGGSDGSRSAGLQAAHRRGLDGPDRHIGCSRSSTAPERAAPNRTVDSGGSQARR